MKKLTGINFLKDVSEVTTLCECPSCDCKFVLEDLKKFIRQDKKSLFFIVCPDCSKELDFFFWFEW